MGFDETWRWRKGVAGKFQERFWNQITNLLAAQTFAVMDERLALDTDSFNYTPGSVANLRARIRDDKRRTNLAGALWSGGALMGATGAPQAGSADRDGPCHCPPWVTSADQPASLPEAIAAMVVLRVTRSASL
jgi:hypothetical protein